MGSRAAANVTVGRYTIVNSTEEQLLVCYKTPETVSHNIWTRIDPVSTVTPTFILQLSVVILLSKILIFLLKPARQPRFVCEVLAGILLGPTFDGVREAMKIKDRLTPFEGAIVLETLSSLGLTYYMFVSGLEMDPTPLRNISRTAFALTVAGIVVPLVAGAALYSFLADVENQYSAKGAIFWSLSLTVTSFADLARTLSDLKLLHTDLGKTALTTALAKDIIAMVLLVGVVSTINGQNNLLAMLPTMAYIVIFWMAVRPFLAWVIRRTENKGTAAEPYSDGHVFSILAGVLLCGIITEMVGAHPMLGAFLLGLSMPSGELGTKIMGKVEEFVREILLPPLFLTIGLRTNLQYLYVYGLPVLVSLIIFLACCLKIMSTLLVSVFLKESIRDGFILGVLLNSKGVLALIVLMEARDLMAFDQQIFAVVMLAMLVMTALVGPIVSLFHQPFVRGNPLSFKSLESSKLVDSDFRILACVHSAKNVSGMTNLLQHFYASIRSPVTVFAVHLVELTGLSSAMLIFHNDSKHSRSFSSSSGSSSGHVTREKAEADNIINAFNSFARDIVSVYIQPLTAVSAYQTMHEDISNFALDKSVALILLPFEVGQTEENQHQQAITQNLLAISPCSVGIIINRSSPHSSEDESNFSIAVFFIGGPDYREALAYAWRASKAPGVSVTVLRFISGKDLEDCLPEGSENILTALMEWENEKQQDEDYINEFRFRTMYDKSITYIEKQVNRGDEIFMTIRSGLTGFDLYVVGRGRGTKSPLTLGMSEWGDHPELGPIGEGLLASDFAEESSILVLQQSDTNRKGGTEGNQGLKGTFVNHKTNDSYDH